MSAHRITIERVDDRVRIAWKGQTLADSRSALRLQEGPLAPVLYFPQTDVRMDLLRRTETQTHCPFKGAASYWSVDAPDAKMENAVWSYETPLAEVDAIAGHVAFYNELLPGIEERFGDD